ncbi:MAG: outer membrane lipoprotein-sorting protein [Treponema sp.]|jgi:outer membrane lipoprotein-sorting protein|nr:outer membrane lipoprotein-sorting protein [Treponema sp.]
MNRKNAVILSILLVSAVHVFAQTSANDIIAASRERIKAETTSARTRWVLTAKDGSTAERLIDQYGKKGAKGDRAVIVFQQPASVKGTRFLTMENQGAADDQWIYLPSLNKVRRISSSEGSGSFMGTDLSYDDVGSSNRDAGLDTHTLLREEDFNGRPCYVIESKPKDASYQYSRMLLWIDRDSKLNWKIECYDKKNTLVKVLEVLSAKDVQGYITPTVTKMSTLAAGTSTTINVDIIKYDDPIPESVFTTSYLETGRAR